jgi:histidyl-tRNA synthetase
LAGLGHDFEVITTIQSVLRIKDMSGLEKVLKDESMAISELNILFDTLDSYEISEWVEFDASIVRGLAYYTGAVFEAHDRAGKFRAICGGGRYDKLLSTLGGKDLPATGFGFGDMVIMELLTEKGLIPELSTDIDDLVLPLNPDLRNAAIIVASSLRNSDRTVDLVLEDKKMKWAFKHAERIGAKRLVLLAPDEWSRKMVKIKDLDSGEESEVPLSGL